ncbi:glycosyltransferase family 2 protein [Patescibacteria group bacterium]|nr:glycosyltransferase family 2 protein [Patescibacteria group bacterium]
MKIYPKVSIIIVNWNGWQDTLGCLNSVLNINYSNYEVIVVDNGSTDESRARLINWKRKTRLAKKGKANSLNKRQSHVIKLIFNYQNLGFAQGNNVAIRQVLQENTSKFILLLNNDTIVERNFLKKLIVSSSNQTNVGILGPKIYYANFKNKKNIIQSAGFMINLYLGKFLSVEQLNKSDKKLINIAQNVDFVTGACLLIKTEVIRQIGLLDKKYFLLFEDADWCLRAKQAGSLVVYIPQSIIYHKTSQSFKKERVSQVYYYTRNIFLFESKHARIFQLTCFLFTYFLFVFPIYFFGYIFVKKNRRSLIHYLHGIKDGISLLYRKK